MWVLYWAGKPCAWLSGSSVTTIGRKGAVITITDDPSISRIHVTVTVGMTAVALPAPITFTDGSKYGATVEILAASASAAGASDLTGAGGAKVITLPQGVDWTPPAAATRIRLTVGTHGACFDCIWESSSVALVGVPESERASHVDQVARSGAYTIVGTGQVEAVARADVVLAHSLEPLSATVAALCLAKPIVGLQYFHAINTRLTPKVPPPESASLVSLPTKVDPVWNTILSPSKQAAAAAVSPIDPSIFLPRLERRTVFAAQTFLCLQEVLYRELSVYVPHAGGRVVLDTVPESATSARTSSLLDALRPFALRHREHVLVYTALASINESALNGLRALGILTVDYTDIVRAILLVSPLRLHATSADIIRMQGPGDHVTSADAASPPPPSPAAVAAPVGSKRDRDAAAAAAPLGAQSMHELDASQPRRPQPRGMAGMPLDVHSAAAGNGAGDRFVYEDLIATGPPKLPNFPCFTDARGGGGHQAATAAGSQKCFVKQVVVAQPAEYMAMDVMAPRTGGNGAPVPTRVALVDADDIVPNWNAFDAVHTGVVSHHARAPRSAGTRTAPVAAAAVVDDPFGDGADITASPPAAVKSKRAAPKRAKAAPLVTVSTAFSAPAPAPAPRVGGGGGIFDVDALY
jgi:hypothetical protein